MLMIGNTQRSRSLARGPVLVVLALVIALGLTLSGCNTTELVDKPTTWVKGLVKTGKWEQMERAPLNEVEIVTIEHVVDYGSEETTISTSSRRSLVDFLRRSNVNGADRVTLHGPRRDFGAHDPVTAQRLEVLKAELSQLGVLSSIPPADRIQPSDPDAVAMLVTRAVVITPDCSQTPPPTTERPVWTKGCSNTANLGQMVYDPLDLKQGRQLTPADGEAGAAAIQRYREGEIIELDDTQTSTTGGEN